MRIFIFMAIFTSLLSACAFTPTTATELAFKDPGFAAFMDGNVEKIKKKPDYRRIPIDTQAQEDEFVSLYYNAYQKKISKEEFVDKMNAIYPDYVESIQWNADQLPN